MKTLQKLINLLLIWSLLWPFGVSPVNSQGQTTIKPISTSTNSISIDFHSFAQDEDLQQAVFNPMLAKPANLLPGNQFAVTSERDEGDWRFISIASLDGPDCSLQYVGAGDCGSLILAAKDEKDNWQAALAGTEAFSSLLEKAPESLISLEAKGFIDPRTVAQRAVENLTYKFPWAAGDWEYRGGWHLTPWGVDIGTRGANADKRVLAAASGTVNHICRVGTKSTNVKIVHDDGNVLSYVHIDKFQMGSGIVEGARVSRGQVLGNLRLGTYSFDGCSETRDQATNSGHLHWALPTNITMTVEGWEIRYPNNTWKKGSETREPHQNPYDMLHSTNEPIGEIVTISCPDDSNGVILYRHRFYDCGGLGEGSGYVRRDTPGLYANVGGGFNDQASSIRVPSGWSVKLYQDENRGGGWACRHGNDDNFWGDHFNNGVPLEDQVTSFEVFDSPNCGENHPPNTPSPQNPSNGYVADDGRAPTLCWNNPGDPDGNSLSYYAEVYDSPVTANSGWRSSTCWRASQLDGHYHSYKWRVKARDTHGAESGWSATWQFTLETPNQPPAISFNTANGDSFSSGRIDDNEGDWLFQGSASDADGSIAQIEFRCAGDNCGSYHSQSGLSNWSYERHGLAGRNDIYFRAYDNDGSATSSRHLDLRIDLAKPATTVSLNNEGNPANWPTWFQQPVQVRLLATDGGTGRARSGIDRIRYRIDGGSWQTHNGSDVNFTLNSDGVHTVEYYAVDKVDNQESSDTVTFKIDQTSPTAPSGVNETHGVVSNDWQKDHDTPTFTWNASSDATSGLWGYQFYFGTDANGTSNHKTLLASDPRQWEPRPNGAATGTYYLRGRTRDNAGNWSNWVDLFTFRYDGTPPHNPNVTNDDGLVSGVWQNSVRTADFSWQPAQDTGSGIAGYYIYWGADEHGTSTSLSTANEFVSTTPICGSDDACTHYLRIQTEDNVGWTSEWVTAFALRYDNAPPTVDLLANYGQPTAHQTTIRLDITAADEGSGAQQMRLSNEGTTWSDWLPLEETIYWDIPNVGRRDYDILIQVADAIPNLSEVMSDTVFLDVNQPRPKSENFSLWTDVWDAGGNKSNSLSFQLDSSVGQSLDSSSLNSSAYQIFSGYHAAALAEPTETITYTHYTQLGQVIASAGTPGGGIHSNSFQLLGTLGQSAHVQTISSISYTIDFGYWGGMVPSEPSEEPPPPPPPPSEADCEFYQVSINDGALYTNQAEVDLNLCGPYVTEVQLSNDGGFGGAVWQPYTTTIPWTLELHANHVQSRIVYARFNNVQGNFFDDIIYDPNPPTDASLAVGESIPQTVALRSLSRSPESSKDGLMRVSNMLYTKRVGEQVLEQPLPLLATNTNGTVDLYLSAVDNETEVTQMQISASPNFTDTDWQAYSAYQAWTPEGEDGVKTVYARFQDSAGNESDPVETSFVLDTSSPLGGLAFSESVVGSDFITTTVYFDSQDNLTAVTDMRISTDPIFSDTSWQAYSTTVTFPLSITSQSEEAIYVQYRDAMGNISDVYSETYLVDTTPPVVYVEVAAGNTLTRPVTVLSYDAMAQVETMHLSNDPLMIEDMVTLPYTETVAWTFDERRVVWVQVEDSVGNLSDPYPAYAGNLLWSMGLQTGWNAIAWPLSPQVSYTAQSLCEQLNGQGSNVIEIDRWHNGGWEGHICGQEFNNFDLVLGATYFIKSGSQSSWSMQGYRVTEPVSLTLQEGWNAIAIPHTDAYTAQSLCDDMIAQGVSAVEIDRWHNGGWQGHICGLPFNDFNIERGTGYFVKSDSSGTVTPSEE